VEFCQGAGDIGAKQHVADDLGSLCAGDGLGWLIGTVFIALQNTEAGQQVDCCGVFDGRGIGKGGARSGRCGGRCGSRHCHGGQAQCEYQSQCQREDLFQISHG
jgi:hypothetical protein